MKVLGLVSFRIFPTHMGGQKGVALFYQYLQQYVPVVLAVSNDNQESRQVATEKLLYPNKKIYRNLSRIKTITEFAKAKEASVIIAEHSYTGWLAWRLHRSTGLPFVIHSHNIESKRFQQMKKWWWKVYRKYEGWIHRKAHHNFFISEEDLQLAIKEFRLSPSRCSVVTYGTEHTSVPKKKGDLRKTLGLPEDKIILLFNGTLDYEPNMDAVAALADHIEPLLRERLDNFLVLITGNRARKPLIEKMLSSQNLLYQGYVEDVHLYYEAADLFLNPVSNDTGIKTKLVEAIASNCTTVSTRSGAAGIRKELCGKKLVTVDDNDWSHFADEVVHCLANKELATPPEFFHFYNWSTIAKKASEKIIELARAHE